MRVRGKMKDGFGFDGRLHFSVANIVTIGTGDADSGAKHCLFQQPLHLILLFVSIHSFVTDSLFDLNLL